MTDLLRASGITKNYYLGRTEVPVLKGVDLSIMDGEIVALVGASGAGKSTLLHVLGLLDPPTSGVVSFAGDNVSDLSSRAKARFRNKHIGFVFQFYHLIAELTAIQNVCLGAMMLRSVPRWLRDRKQIRARAEALLGQMGLSERLSHRPSQLSGGERQRVAIARALISEPSIILADEPTGNLDSHTAAEILELIWEINETHGISFLLVTHNEEVARRADRTIRLEDGRTV